MIVSSQAVYGTERTPPWSETMTPEPETSYGLSKWIGEQLCVSTGELETVVLRGGRTFGKGPNMRWGQFPFIASAYQGEPLEVYGNGSQRMDLVHVSDVGSAITEACAVGVPSSRHAVFNVGSGNPIAVRDIALLVQTKTRQFELSEPDSTYHETQKKNGPTLEWTSGGPHHG